MAEPGNAQDRGQMGKEPTESQRDREGPADAWMSDSGLQAVSEQVSVAFHPPLAVFCHGRPGTLLQSSLRSQSCHVGRCVTLGHLLNLSELLSPGQKKVGRGVGKQGGSSTLAIPRSPFPLGPCTGVLQWGAI